MATPVLMPKLGLTMEVGVVSSWLKREGEEVRKGDPVLEVETDKIVTEVQAPESGVLLRVLVPAGAEVKVQTVLGVIGRPGEDVTAFAAQVSPRPDTGSEAAPSAITSPDSAPVSREGRSRITPRARKLLEEKGYSVADLGDLGKGRITEADVQEFLRSRGGGTKPFSRVEKIVAARMTESFRDIPQFSLRFVAEMDRALALLPGMRQESGADISLNDLVLRAVAIALSRFPDAQYQYRPDGIFVPPEINLGFAVASGRDLWVPVIRDAGSKGIGEISRAARDLAERARENRLGPDDVGGGTFTVSNLGMFEISSFVPIVNPGEGGILGVGAVHAVPRLRSGTLAEAKVVELTLVCDHRSVNGAIAAEYCRQLKKLLESPEEATW